MIKNASELREKTEKNERYSTGYGATGYFDCYKGYPEELYEREEDHCLAKQEIDNYGKGKPLYGWHISNLKIYDKSKELSEFRTLCKYRNEDGSCQYKKVECDCVKFDFNPDYSVNFAKCCDYMFRPPQSWCYIEKR